MKRKDTNSTLIKFDTPTFVRKLPDDEEHRIQVACVTWFRFAFPKLAKVLFAVPNGGQRNVVVAAKMRAEGVTAGVADLLLLVANKGYHGLCIEMKTANGKQSELQKEWQLKAEEQGYKYVICRSLDDFMETINSYFNERIY